MTETLAKMRAIHAQESADLEAQWSQTITEKEEELHQAKAIPATIPFLEARIDCMELELEVMRVTRDHQLVMAQLQQESEELDLSLALHKAEIDREIQVREALYAL